MCIQSSCSINVSGTTELKARVHTSNSLLCEALSTFFLSSKRADNALWQSALDQYFKEERYLCLIHNRFQWLYQINDSTLGSREGEGGEKNTFPTRHANLCCINAVAPLLCSGTDTTIKDREKMGRGKSQILPEKCGWVLVPIPWGMGWHPPETGSGMVGVIREGRRGIWIFLFWPRCQHPAFSFYLASERWWKQPEN